MTGKLPIAFQIVLIISLTAVFNCASHATPKNVIFMIGDGMGFEQVKAGGMYLNGEPGTLSFESFPYKGQVTTSSANNAVTDSAAAGTALATGHKVNNEVISTAIPGDSSEYQTLLEYLRDLGKVTGLVTTSYMTDATPAAFGAHASSRSNTANIAADYRSQTNVNVLLGGGGNGMTTQNFIDAGYAVVTDANNMLATGTENTAWLCGQFGSGQMKYEADGIGNQPHLSEMALTALNILDGEPNGFFLMIEGGNIDHAGHSSNLKQNVFETVEFNNTVQAVLGWLNKQENKTDTLILVTADHETGGLKVNANNGAGVLPSASWNGGGNHTSANVPVYAWGENAQLVSGVMDNTQMFLVCTATPGCGAWKPYPEDGSVYRDTKVTLSWIPEADANSHDIYFGTSFEEVSDANENAFLINQAGTSCSIGAAGNVYPDALVPGTTYYWRIDEINNVDPNNPYRGDVWSFYIPPVIAWNPIPANGGKFVPQNITLSWSGALGVGTITPHRVYFGQDYNDVLAGTGNTFKGSLNKMAYAPGNLEKDRIYYWRVDETIGDGRFKYINKGDVWSFAVDENLVLEDFEDYNDTEPERLIDTWKGGNGDPNNGAIAGYYEPNLAADEHYAETVIVNSGGQSMPVFYDNNSMYSQVRAALSSDHNWAEPNLPVLSLMFRGCRTNDAEPMYVGISDNTQRFAAIYNSDPNAVLSDKWTQWDIALASFTNMGIDLTDVENLFIGFGNPADIKSTGGSGVLYIDDIRLYKPVEP